VLVRIGCFGRLASGEMLGRGVASLVVIVEPLSATNVGELPSSQY
jgi:hypothetical protein